MTNKIAGKDRKGRIIRIGDPVIMPDPYTKHGDIWAEGNWVGIVEKRKTGEVNDQKVQLITVTDSEGDCFDVEPERVCLEDERYPIYCREDLNNLQNGLYLAMFHGFKDEEEREQLDDRGSNGPVIGPLKYVHTTYATHVKVQFLNAGDADKYGLPEETLDEISINKEGCIEFDGMQYGDWTVFYTKKGEIA